MTTYKEAGVDIDVANEGLKRIKKHVSSTYNKYTLSDILIGFIDNDVHIFKPESLKNIKLTNNILQNSIVFLEFY